MRIQRNKFRIGALWDNPKYYKGIWLECRGGGSGEWLYAARRGVTYYFIRILDLPDWCGRDATNLFCADVLVADLLATDATTMVGALETTGDAQRMEAVHIPVLLESEAGRFDIAASLVDCGAVSPLWHEEGGTVVDVNDRPSEMHPAFRKIRSDARKEAESLFDESYLSKQMGRVVNGIGQTAREYAQGTEGLWTAIRRLQQKGEAATVGEKLVIRAYSVCTHLLGGEQIPSDIRENSTIHGTGE